MALKIETFTTAQTTALGNAIDAAHPYSAVHTKSLLLPSPPATIQWKRDGAFLVEAGSNSGDPNYWLRFDDGIEVSNEVGDWKFKGAPHYIQRAIRIQYMYYAPSKNESDDAGTAILTKDYLIIAYEGGGGY